MDSTFTFNEDEHRYYLKNVEIPGVTKTLEEVGISDFSFVDFDILEKAKRFGSALHRATELLDKGTLNESSVDNALIPYLQGYKMFCEDYGFVPEMVEFQSYSAKYRYGFTLDRIGSFSKQKHSYYSKFEGKRALIDIKSGAFMPSYALQTAAYLNGYNEHFPRLEKVRLRICVRLCPGHYKIDVHKDKSDFSTWLACLQVYNFMLANKIKKHGGSDD